MFKSKDRTPTLEEQEQRYSRKPGTGVQDCYLSIGEAEARMVFTPFKKKSTRQNKSILTLSINISDTLTLADT